MGTAELFTRFEGLETSYLQKDDELRRVLNWFIADQSQLAKCFRRDVEDLKRMQQEHMSKLEIHSVSTSFDDLIQQQVNKFYHFKHGEEEDDDDDEENVEREQKMIQEFGKLHDGHAIALKKKKKAAKLRMLIVERFRMCSSNDFLLATLSSRSSRGTLRSSLSVEFSVICACVFFSSTLSDFYKISNEEYQQCHSFIFRSF